MSDGRAANGCMELSDRDLVRRFLDQRDEEAFRALFRPAHAEGVRPGNAARRWPSRRRRGRRSGHVAARGDWLRSFEWKAALSTWLAGIVINCARERLRADTRFPVVEADVATVPARVEWTQTDVDLERAIARLPDGARLVLVLHDVEGYTHEEIASRLEGISPRVHRRVNCSARGDCCAPASPARRWRQLMNQDDPLTPDERAALERLPREMTTPSALEDRVVARLRESGAIRSRRRVPALAAAAAILLLTAGGFALGRLTSGSAPLAGDRDRAAVVRRGNGVAGRGGGARQ